MQKSSPAMQYLNVTFERLNLLVLLQHDRIQVVHLLGQVLDGLRLINELLLQRLLDDFDALNLGLRFSNFIRGLGMMRIGIANRQCSHSAHLAIPWRQTPSRQQRVSPLTPGRGWSCSAATSGPRTGATCHCTGHSATSETLACSSA